ncbi:hypothetical protein [Gaoshiqia sediminis]|uniref:Uncharacterized protein n=1 Tax=Gaoshiqia sediminis TaxID=2986998 RepID=A0AA41YD15_9BACT|nr:hypothetical protein [Gaoshiqia sediminis]MCW0484418.1 hypothetical protein [Gaoshiqia sediminis]
MKNNKLPERPGYFTIKANGLFLSLAKAPIKETALKEWQMRKEGKAEVVPTQKQIHQVNLSRLVNFSVDYNSIGVPL